MPGRYAGLAAKALPCCCQGRPDEDAYRQNRTRACCCRTRRRHGPVATRALSRTAEAYERDNGRNSDRGDRNQAGAFDYYVLALSWSPTYCADRRGNGYEPQCDVRSSRPYAFVLHGLWPQHERGWPQDCRSSDRGWVPGPVAERMLDIMPSKKLIFHEYRKHGTCSGLGVDDYFDLARRLHDKVQIPKRFVRLTDDRLFVGPGELVQRFPRRQS